MIQKERPDIVITDIEMPGLSGLDIIRQCRENNISTPFIIVSGYQEFEYAKQALRYKVEDYLLKPIDETALNGILKKICSDIERISSDRADAEGRFLFYLQKCNTKSNLCSRITVNQRRPDMKRIALSVAIIILALSLRTYGQEGAEMPEFHPIAYDPALDTLEDEDGADAFNHTRITRTANIM